MDCNSFYASCERVFRPDLKNRPIAVLSNNDGCIVAMSSELKKMGVQRGEPYFKVKAKLKREGVVVFSSNYTLYQDLSNRVFSILKEYAPIGVEIYSIDEAFFFFDETKVDSGKLANEIIFQIKKQTGIPVSIGIATTKTLAKIANSKAKNSSTSCFIFPDDKIGREKFLETVLVSKIWGIGRSSAKFLNNYAILNAKQFIECDDLWVKEKLTIRALRTVRELRGDCAVLSEDIISIRKGFFSSKSFSRALSCYKDMQHAVSLYATKAVEKMQKQGSICSEVYVMLSTNRFKSDYYNASTIRRFSSPTNYLPDIIKSAHNALYEIYRDEKYYVKVGVGLSKLTKPEDRESFLFDKDDFNKQSNLQYNVDKLNNRFGQGALFVLSANPQSDWSMKRNYLSPRYITRWAELPKCT